MMDSVCAISEHMMIMVSKAVEQKRSWLNIIIRCCDMDLAWFYLQTKRYKKAFDGAPYNVDAYKKYSLHFVRNLSVDEMFLKYVMMK